MKETDLHVGHVCCIAVARGGAAVTGKVGNTSQAFAEYDFIKVGSECGERRTKK